MEAEAAKQKLLEMLGLQLAFSNEFEKYFSILKESMQESLLQWCSDCKDGLAKGSVPTSARHKGLFVFFRKIGENVRAVLIKKQNAEFIELHLVSHKQYDDIRLMLGYKKSSYYSS